MSDKEKPFQQIGMEFEDDYRGRARKLLAFLQERAKEVEGNPDALLATVDEYCYSSDRRMMHVGDKKGLCELSTNSRGKKKLASPTVLHRPGISWKP